MTFTEIIIVIMTLIGGLGLFLVGMQFMSEGLQKSSGNSLKKILEKLTSNRVIGTGVGAAVTAIIQSSSATTVMVVGFVNAGLISLTQALSVILGANIGTTITGQIIAFKVSAIALPAVGIGAILYIFFKKPILQYSGQIILGFGMLFLGMEIMTDSFSPLAKSEGFKEIFVTFSTNPLLAVFAGAVTTLIVQSSSATMGITIALATAGIIDFSAAAALVLGENIGTTITANLAALNASKIAKQAAFGHFLFNLIGVTYMIILLQPFMYFINAMTPGDVHEVVTKGTEQIYPNIGRHIANLHTMFNIINTAIFLPFLPLLAKLCEKIIKDDKNEEKENTLTHLSNEMLTTPEIAVGVVKEEIDRMFYNACDVFYLSKQTVIDNKKDSGIQAKDTAKKVYKMGHEINAFIQKLSSKPLSAKSMTEVHNMSMAVEEVRQLAERSYKLVKAKNKIIEKEISFSITANQELQNTFSLVENFINHFSTSFIKDKEKNTSTELDLEEDTIDNIRKDVKKNHLERLEDGICSLQAGLSFMDLINNLEKIADNVYQLAQIIVDNRN